MSWNYVDEVINCEGDKYELLCKIGEDNFSIDEIKYLGLVLFNMPFRSGQTKSQLMNTLKGAILARAHWDSMDIRFKSKS